MTYPHKRIELFCESCENPTCFVKLHRMVFTKVYFGLQINGKQSATFQFSVKLFSNKMQEATFKLVLTQRQYVDRSY